jgi:hypothetical protein
MKEYRGEILFSISWINQGRTDGRNLLKRFREISRIVESRRGASGLRQEDSEEIRSSGEVESSIQNHRSRQIYTWYRVSGTRELKPQSCAAKSNDIARCDKIRVVRCGGHV